MMNLFKAFLLVVFFFCIASSAVAQKAISYAIPKQSGINKSGTFNPKTSIITGEESSSQRNGFFQKMQDLDILDHLDIAAYFGTTGLGIDIASPIGEYVQLRLGFSYMPRFEMSSHFRVQLGDSLDNKYDAAGHRIETKFDKLSGYLKSLFGYEVKDDVEMKCKPIYNNFKLMVDAFPFPDKRWHVTAGFFAGPSEIAQAYNTTEDMPTLLSATMWNNLCDKFNRIDPIYAGIEEKFLGYGHMAFHAGYYTRDGINSNGKEFKKGDPYMMVPDGKSGMVKVAVKVNRFKPYLGFGFGGAVSKDQKTMLSFDAGAMFWGGTPAMITHEGINLMKDVENVNGKLGRYVDAAKVFKVFPVLEFRISRRIF